MSKIISIICVFNNEQQLNSCLVKSLLSQKSKYELILVDGSKGNYPSCASALNYGVSKSKGNILIFSHQDVYLKDPDAIEQFASFIANKPNETVVGVAGAIECHKNNFGNYTSGLMVNNNRVFNVKEPKKVSCIDECFFGMLRSTYEKHPFDECICDNWHLYAVEQCLYHREKRGCVYIFPIQIHHLSRGTISLKYMDGLVKLTDKYRKSFKFIWTTCYKVPANRVLVRALRFAWKLNRIIRKQNY